MKLFFSFLIVSRCLKKNVSNKIDILTPKAFNKKKKKREKVKN